jgi:hypothetical protein
MEVHPTFTQIFLHAFSSIISEPRPVSHYPCSIPARARARARASEMLTRTLTPLK